MQDMNHLRRFKTLWSAGACEYATKCEGVAVGCFETTDDCFTVGAWERKLPEGNADDFIGTSEDTLLVEAVTREGTGEWGVLDGTPVGALDPTEGTLVVGTCVVAFNTDGTDVGSFEASESDLVVGT